MAEGFSLGSSSCTCTGFVSCPSSGQRQIWSLAARLSGLRQVRNVCCSRWHWTELFCVTSVPKMSLFLSQEPVPSLRQHCPSTTTLPPPADVSPIQMGHPWASTHHQEPSPLFLAWELVPGVQSRGKTRGTSQQRAGQQLQAGGTKPAGAWLTSLPSNRASLLWQERAGSTNHGGEAFLAQEPVSGWVESPYALSGKYLLQTLGRSTRRLQAPQGTMCAVTKNDTSPGAVLTRPVIAREILRQNTQRNH